MKLHRKSITKVLLLLLPMALGLGACLRPIPTSPPLFPVEIGPLEISISQEWYVSPTGNDDNDCQTESTPCQTITQTLGKIEEYERDITAPHSSSHTVNLAPGTYTDAIAITLRNNITLQGAGLANTIIDVGEDRTGIHVTGNVNAAINDLNIQNAVGSSGNGVLVNSDVRSFSMRNVRVRDNAVNGILIQNNYEDPEPPIVTLTNVLAIRNGDDGLESGGDVTIRGGRYNLNGEYGIKVQGELSAANITIANNGIGGLSFGGSQATLNNLSVRLNGTASSFSGVRPGILIGSGRVTLSSSRITANIDGVYIGHSDSDVTIDNTIFNSNEGTAVLAIEGSLLITDTNILNNSIGGLFVENGNVTLNDVTIAYSDDYGILNQHGLINFTRGEIRDNSNYGINNQMSGEITLTEVIVSDNGLGAPDIHTYAIRNTSTSVMHINQSQIRGNIGGIFNGDSGEVTLIESSVTGSRGPANAILNGWAPSETPVFHVERSLIANNLGTDIYGYNAAVYNNGTMNILNSTISNNSGNGIMNYDDITLSYVTIAENSEVGLLTTSYSTRSDVENSLIAKNRIGDCGLGGVYSFMSTNITTSEFSCGLSSSLIIFVSPADLLLGALADNGGPTFTHALEIGSPAIDAATGTCPGADQRGATRPFGTSCDVGAYEFDPTFGATTLSLDDETLEFATVTPTPQFVFTPPLVILDSLCWTGPGNQYGVVSSVKKGVEVKLLGTGDLEGWLVVNNPLYNVPCWLPEDNLDLDPKLDLSTFKVFPVPPLPTPTITQAQPTATATPKPIVVAPNAPSSLAAAELKCNSTDGYIVKLTWKDNASNETGYRVYHNGGLIATLGANATQYTTGDLGSGGVQNFYVQAFNNAGTANSNTAQEDGCIY